MTLYAESSAVLAWLLGEKAGEPVREALAAAALVLASEITLVESDRVLIRGEALKEFSHEQAGERRAVLNAAARTWTLLRLSSEVIDGARRPFPAEPLRTLDALHVATAILARGAVPGLIMLSLDRRVRKTARELEFPLLPL